MRIEVKEVIETVLEDGDIASAIDALEDGAYLAGMGWPQDVVEAAWEYLKYKVAK